MAAAAGIYIDEKDEEFICLVILELHGKRSAI